MNEKLKLPTQGYWGKLVEHDDMKTSIGDWQEERPWNGRSRREICEKHPENVWCERYMETLDSREHERSSASATMSHRSMLALAVVFACAAAFCSLVFCCCSGFLISAF